MTKSATHHYGKIIHGMLTYYNKALLDLDIRELDGMEFDLVLKEKKKHVSLDTHGYYRGGVLREALKYETFPNWTEDQLHDFFADMYLKEIQIKQIKFSSGHESIREVPHVISTASLSQKEMNDYIQKVIGWLAVEGIVIHPPEQYYLRMFKSHEK